MPDTRAVMDRLHTVLTTIESVDPQLGANVSSFLVDHIIDPDDPDSYTLCLQYAEWALRFPDLASERQQTLHPCKCWRGSGWNFDPEDPNSVRPCDRSTCPAGSGRVAYWMDTIVDSDSGPR